MMWEYLFTNQVIRLSRICSMGLLIGYAAGTLNTWLTLARGGYPLSVVVGQTVPEMANGIAVAIMGCAILLMLGELFEKPVFTMGNKFIITTGLKRIVIINFFILASAFAAGRFQQGGAKNASDSHAGVLSIFLAFLLSPTVVLATIAFLVEKIRTQKYIYGGIALFLWLVEVTQGRRDLVYPALVTIGLARYAGYRWNRISFSRLLMTAFALLFLFLGVLTYQLMRVAGSTGQSRNLVVEAHQVGEWAQQGRAWRMATASSVANVKTRTLIIKFLSDILYREQTNSPVYGKDLLLQTEIAIPSVIERNKPTIGEEDLASQAFGVHYPDEPNSIFTLGAVDFGVLGVMVYPIIIILLFSGFLRIAYAYFSNEVFFYGLVSFIYIAMQAEVTFISYLVNIRNLITFALLLYMISRIPSITLGNGDAKQGHAL